MVKLATVFSGVGAVEQALLKLKIPTKIIFACDSGERYIDIDEKQIYKKIENMTSEERQLYIKILYAKVKKENFVKKTYFENYKINEENWYEDIRFIDGKKYKNKVDILVGGSPCQTFSIIGKKAGLEDTRGTLFYNFANLIKEIEPRVFIFENVVGMITHNKGQTWNVIDSVFKGLGYQIYGPKILNSKDYGIPQDRKRIFVVGFKDKVNFQFPPVIIKKNLSIKKYLENNKDVYYMHYLGKKGFEFVTNPKYSNRARIDKQIIQTQKANQQFNWNGDFIFVPYEQIKDNKLIMSRAYIGDYNGKKGAIRQLTHRECFRLMGFPNDFKIVVPNVQAYRQAGNSIVVDVLENILKEIMKVVDFSE